LLLSERRREQPSLEVHDESKIRKGHAVAIAKRSHQAEISGHALAEEPRAQRDDRTVERIGELLRTARKRFRTLGFNIRSKHDDGRIGWPELAPFDAIIVTAAAPALVDALTMQLAQNGTLVAPVGASGGQSLVRLRKDESGAIDEASLAPVVFVPLLPGMVD
jgi:protein-L-isoaspartate(D-aspartate) O-methyltransferase